MASTFKGRVGELRHGYQTAARLGPWTLADERVEATVVEVNDVWLEAEPLDLRLTIGSQEWVWRGVEVRSRDPMVVVVRGSPERRPK